MIKLAKLVILFNLVFIQANSQTINSNETYDYVDLGLSVKWATKNVGASSITDYGDFFAWAETAPKDEYDWTTYKYTEPKSTRMTKYCNSSLGAVRDYKTMLEPIDDAATVNWGNQWRMPSLDEMNELLQNCKWIWYSNYNGSGINGYLVQSRVFGYTDKSIFLPAGGHWGGGRTHTTQIKKECIGP